MELRKHLSEDILKKIRRKTYSSGEIIRGIGEKKIAFIIEGKAKAVRYEKGEESVFPLIVRKGWFIGMYGHYKPDKEDWEVVALTKVEAVIFSKEEAEKYLFKNIQILEYMMKKFMNTMEVCVRGFYIQTRGGARSALAYYLLDLIDGKNEISLKEYVNLSNILGISRSMLYRVTRELEEKEVVKRKQETLWISDIEKLKSYYEEYLY